MKNRVAILFATVLLLQALAPFARQLARVPALVTHFMLHHNHEHHAHGDGLTFLDFLAQHYGHKPHHNDAGQEHSHLPFHAGDSGASGLLLALTWSLSPIGFGTCIQFQRQVFGSESFYSSRFVRDIFRPPLG